MSELQLLRETHNRSLRDIASLRAENEQLQSGLDRATSASSAAAADSEASGVEHAQLRADLQLANENCLMLRQKLDQIQRDWLQRSSCAWQVCPLLLSSSSLSLFPPPPRSCPHLLAPAPFPSLLPCLSVPARPASLIPSLPPFPFLPQHVLQQCVLPHPVTDPALCLMAGKHSVVHELPDTLLRLRAPAPLPAVRQGLLRPLLDVPRALALPEGPCPLLPVLLRLQLQLLWCVYD